MKTSGLIYSKKPEKASMRKWRKFVLGTAKRVRTISSNTRSCCFVFVFFLLFKAQGIWSCFLNFPCGCCTLLSINHISSFCIHHHASTIWGTLQYPSQLHLKENRMYCKHHHHHPKAQQKIIAPLASTLSTLN